MYKFYGRRETIRETKFVKITQPDFKEKDIAGEPKKRMSTQGFHLFYDKNLLDKSTTVSKNEFSKLLVTIIKDKEKEKDKDKEARRTENKIYDFYTKNDPTLLTSVIKQFYTPQPHPNSKPPARKSTTLLITAGKNKNEMTALKEYMNKRSDNKIYDQVLKNILIKGYKQLPDKRSPSANSFNFDEQKIFMKYNLITQKETDIKFVLETLKKEYIAKQNKPKFFLSLSKNTLMKEFKNNSIGLGNKLKLSCKGNEKYDGNNSQFTTLSRSRMISDKLLLPRTKLSQSSNKSVNKYYLNTVS
jgi:hypothetical protein